MKTRHSNGGGRGSSSRSSVEFESPSSPRGARDTSSGIRWEGDYCPDIPSLLNEAINLEGTLDVKARVVLDGIFLRIPDVMVTELRGDVLDVLTKKLVDNGFNVVDLIDAGSGIRAYFSVHEALWDALSDMCDDYQHDHDSRVCTSSEYNDLIELANYVYKLIKP